LPSILARCYTATLYPVLGDKEVAVLSRLPIRNKLLFGVTLLLAIVVGLSFSGYQGVYAYRALARGISQRAIEIPIADDLTRHVGELRITVSEAKSDSNIFIYGGTRFEAPKKSQDLRQTLHTSLAAIRETLRNYAAQLEQANPDESLISDNRRELETVEKIKSCIGRIENIIDDEDWIFNDINLPLLSKEVDSLYALSSELPAILQERMHSLADNIRTQYHTWIGLMLTSAVAAVALLALAVYCGYSWIFHPLKVLVMGSRRVAAGDFSYRIDLKSHDEMAELAAAMNHMTARFQQIRDDLDRQVQLRTREVVRSEQLASVGFLAAGVAHEINNPLAAVAMCAESLEMRLHDILICDDEERDAEHNDEIVILRKYLRRIQDEAFRCKGITEKLLDFSRLGDVERQNTDLADLTLGVIEMVRHLGKYRQKNIEFAPSAAVIAPVNAQEIKQVLLNLITNGLDSLEPGGTVHVELLRENDRAVILVRDDGCGMTPEVLKHLFEPFFTRKRDGQGTGLGLSITYRIIEDHGGAIEASSAGPGRGAEFRVTLPLARNNQNEKRQAA
jgi:signal transduction histidine kinase